MPAVHFSLLAAVVVFTLACLLARGGRARRPFRTVLLAFLPFWLIGVTCMLILSADGVPTVEWIIPAIAVLLLGIACRSDALFTLARSGLLLVSILLCVNCLALISSGYTAAPARRQKFRSVSEGAAVRNVAKELRAKHPPDATLPAGKVGEVTLTSVTGEWHTPLTRLYRVERRPAAVWYPGGPIGEAADRLEVRPAG